MSSLDVDECISRLHGEQILSLTQIRSVCERLKEEYAVEKNVIKVQLPVTVVGDIHGYVRL